MTSQQVAVRYKKYPECKPSGNEWLGDIPEGWGINRLKHLSHTRVSNVDKKSEDDVAVRLCNYVDVYKNEFVNEAIDFMPATATARQIEEFQLQYGDVIITKDSETPDDIGVPAFVTLKDNKNVVCGYHLAIITSRSDVLLGRYLFRLLQSKNYRSYYEVSCHGVTRFGLDAYSILNTEIALPSIPEQTAIVVFLDRKTALIDDVVAKKQKLIELLKEKRQALITHAVTKGLDPNAKLKPSGIDWLGDIPERWEIKRLKYLSSTRVSNVDKKSDDETLVRLCNYIDVYKNEFIDDTIDFMAATATAGQIEEFQLEYGDVIITKDSETPDDIGVPAFVRMRKTQYVVCGYHLAIITPVKGILHSGYLFRLLQSKNYGSYFEVNSNGVTRFGLDTYSIYNAEILLPPYSEQRQIADVLDRATEKIDEVVGKVTIQIEKLKEYRQALITDAVTGKIKVAP